MYCANCGAKIPDDSKFCPNCGESVISREDYSSSTQRDGYITFHRVPSGIAVLVKTKVIVDGIFYDDLKENEEVRLKLPCGSHSIELKNAGSPSSYFQIDLSDGSDIYYPFKIGMNGKAQYLGSSTSSASRIPKQKKGSKTLGIITLALVAVVLISMLRSTSGTNNNDTPKPEQQSTEEVEESFPVKSILEPGEVAEYDGLEVCINSYSIQGKDANNSYLIANITVRNPGTDKIKLSNAFSNEYTEKLTFKEEYNYLCSWGYDAKYFQNNEDIKPLETISAILQFEIPNEVVNSNESLVLSFAKNKVGAEEILWKLR